MTRRIVFRPEAEADIDAAVAWLEEQSPSSAAKFWRAVDTTLHRLAENPLQYQRVTGKARRARVAGFRYSLFYIATEDAVVVVACMRGHRHPRRWQERIPE